MAVKVNLKMKAGGRCGGHMTVQVTDLEGGFKEKHYKRREREWKRSH